MMISIVAAGHEAFVLNVSVPTAQGCHIKGQCNIRRVFFSSFPIPVPCPFVKLAVKK